MYGVVLVVKLFVYNPSIEWCEIMNQFDNLNVDAKVVYLLSLSELVINKISKSEGYEVAVVN
ncbi:hypothetical protein C162_33708 [Paenibacillus sp. FSL R7-269]|nr:hypothetical protein C162_33708 [Paenibacillus sp. FSL R7-269]